MNAMFSGVTKLVLTRGSFAIYMLRRERMLMALAGRLRGGVGIETDGYTTILGKSEAVNEQTFRQQQVARNSCAK